MKSFAILFAIVAAVSLRAEWIESEGIDSAAKSGMHYFGSDTSAALRHGGPSKPTADPYRTLDGTNVIHVWRKWQDERRNSGALPNWEWIRGTVSQSTAKGILVRLDGYKSGESVFITRFPQKLQDGAKVSLYAATVGLLEYKSVIGAKNTVRSFDYGIPCAAPQPDPPTAEELAARADAKAKKQAEMDERVAKFKAEQAYKSAHEKQ